MKSIKDIENLKGKHVIVRVDFNVPQDKDGKILDDFRIKSILPTVEYLQKKGAIVILVAHIGEGGEKSLKPVAIRLKKYLPNIKFIESSIFSDETKKITGTLKNGDVALFENLRREIGEKTNSPSFARGLSRFGDIYVNDAFSVSHRVHASIVGITKYLPSYAGLQLIDEINNLSKAFNPKKPFLFILGGAKFETKIPLIKKFLRDADHVFIGGAIANDFFKGKGYEVGTSLVSDGMVQVKSFFKNKNLVIPTDVVVTKGSLSRNVKPSDVTHDECIVDIGKDSVEVIKGLIEKAQFVLWNGPLGIYESGFGSATENILKILSKSKAVSIVGGGDTVALITKLKLGDKLGFVSTGGGATLDFLAKGTLPGIKALK
ncbi:MAG: Phosphoglycerate kinase [Candidatus Nomurabacteria bacterium GW2011_GWF2_35_66]|uniref:Phosphoglycerate kinase n=1 Tax=Candidatus Nomurabacteria bacterium GW2011_GWE1_35_16 TaxID=1618761 RepID=A0A0G0B9H9_9BACT|nr:MAG: Phosphoglycerate kinase [Candidatus Nomurabacteria bacterium GW2011_GWF1_34_20]KKP62107.1 MAG: Phosphoglycerate kinase [Candidatus Nomurabacteria bacterium GW2011_GWE2_34_25]KKP66073.1 MAG: Phosphoglycerate kinase [Candidatus Nomurabacteria bacterium GW2011_GWE1_35_16]KKP83021.1 MAG: Phosphoglycerate kinase [Candidatus Nomurabacteria bacterium GW2011_GWF2_35_66]HAE36982.1 phosphoglycerate kinase [Candidatus Nomurabacteria bacterium]